MFPQLAVPSSCLVSVVAPASGCPHWKKYNNLGSDVYPPAYLDKATHLGHNCKDEILTYLMNFVYFLKIWFLFFYNFIALYDLHRPKFRIVVAFVEYWVTHLCPWMCSTNCAVCGQWAVGSWKV